MARKTHLEAFHEMLADRAFAKKLDDGSDFVPPGYRLISSVRDELGAQELRVRLSAGRMKAHLWSRDGKIEPCAKTFWTSEWAEAAIQTGGYSKYRLLVREEGNGAEIHAEKLTNDATYVSPYMQRMMEASRAFDLGSPKGKKVKKETLANWFREKGLPDGSPISKNLADSMASLCRHPDAMRGGLRRGDWNKTSNLS